MLPSRGYTPLSPPPTTKRVNWWVQWKKFILFLVAVVVLAMAATAIATVVLVTEGESFQRYTVVQGLGNFGQFSVSSNERTIEWDLQHTLAMDDPPLGLQVRGPVPPGQTAGPLLIALCGTPSTLACDISVMGVLKDKIDQTYDGFSLTTTIDKIRARPSAYYLEILSAQNTTWLAPLGNLAGTVG